jgi:hypothetical protein
VDPPLPIADLWVKCRHLSRQSVSRASRRISWSDHILVTRAAAAPPVGTIARTVNGRSRDPGKRRDGSVVREGDCPSLGVTDYLPDVPRGTLRQWDARRLIDQLTSRYLIAPNHTLVPLDPFPMNATWTTGRYNAIKFNPTTGPNREDIIVAGWSSMPAGGPFPPPPIVAARVAMIARGAAPSQTWDYV